MKNRNCNTRVHYKDVYCPPPMDFEYLQYSKTAVDKAGSNLLRDDLESWEDPETYDIVNNWRAAHNWPLIMIAKRLRLASHKVNPDAIVVHRLKRMEAIKDKLSRLKRIRLSQMQDVGGCRAVLPSVVDVRQLTELYRKENDSTIVRSRDYVEKPDSSTGYRSYHLIDTFHTESQEYAGLSNLQIEIQIRSALQHAWATAVEVVDTFENTRLKFGEGTENWRQFFKLMSTYIALKENTAPVQGTPKHINELKRELRSYCTELNVEKRLLTYSDYFSITERGSEKLYSYCLLYQDFKRKMLWSEVYSESHRDDAYERLWHLEAEAEREGNINVVLVSAKSLKELKQAYPNYYADTYTFLGELVSAIS